MNTEERKNIILELLESSGEIDAITVMEVLNIETDVLTKDFKSLLEAGEIIRTSPGKYGKKINIQHYLEQALSIREVKEYNHDFLHAYIPNTDFLLGEDTIKKLTEKHSNTSYSYTENLELIKKIFIDFSYYSNKLAGGNFEKIDTEVLMFFGHSPKGISFSHSQRILNYKNILLPLFEGQENIEYKNIDFSNIHTVLTHGRMETHLQGKLRDFEVIIPESTYNPINGLRILENEYEYFIKILQLIENPLEKSFFIFVFLPYISPFYEGNEELARIFANRVLIQNGYSPLLFEDIEQEKYDFSYRALYELCDVSLLKKIFLQSIE